MKLLKYYKWGDRLGSVVEGGVGNAIRKKSPVPTDESDIVDCFMKFTSGINVFDFKSPEEFALQWYLFHDKSYRVCLYGRAWEDHFLVMRVPKIKYAKTVAISEDRNSLGNGALVLVYPIYLMTRMFGHEAVYAMVETVVAGTHYPAIFSALKLASFFLDDVYGDLGLEGESTSLADGCLYYAAQCAREDSIRGVIREAYRLGGDVDSVLSLALLMHKFERRHDENK